MLLQEQITSLVFDYVSDGSLQCDHRRLSTAYALETRSVLVEALVSCKSLHLEEVEKVGATKAELLDQLRYALRPCKKGVAKAPTKKDW